ncbi:spore coat U domain-containing protein [Pseudomonas syringae]|uniref:Csu type fimbrial protein n=1 Tax=Pseudomonas syringae TaxID=317 RepID=UPI000F01FE8B|nr:spore coat U domain-containing protein [Pseudomonas syringae]MCF5722378.1 fimbrial major subunit CsuA/B family protein [Pseudomonas syringae]
MHALVSKAVFPLMALAWVSGSHAATVAGTVNATLVLTSSCQINGSAATGGMSFGDLTFGTANSLFTESSGQVLGGGGGALSILCSAGTSPTLTVAAGANDGQSTGGTRALFDGVANYVPYDLYTDTGYSNLIAIGGVIPLAASTGVAQAVNIYGRAVGKAGLPAGTYTDTINVTLTF